MGIELDPGDSSTSSSTTTTTTTTPVGTADGVGVGVYKAPTQQVCLYSELISEITLSPQPKPGTPGIPDGGQSEAWFLELVDILADLIVAGQEGHQVNDLDLSDWKEWGAREDDWYQVQTGLTQNLEDMGLEEGTYEA